MAQRGRIPLMAGEGEAQQEAKHGSSPVDLTAICLREDEEERRDPQEGADLPTLFDQLEQSLSAACGPSPASSPSRGPRASTPGGFREPHDSDDDDMQKEEARLRDSAQKLKRALDESTPDFYDASSEDESAQEEEMEDAMGRAETPVRRALSFSAPDTPPQLPPPSIPTQPDHHNQSALAVASSSYWDYPEGHEEEEAFATPLGGAASALPRSSSAFSLDICSLTGSPIRPTPSRTGDADAADDGGRDMHEVVCASERLSEAAVLLRFTGLRFTVGAAESGEGVREAGGLVCRHLAIFNIRPDAAAGAITALLVGAAQAQGLVVTRRQGSHVVAGMPSTSPDRWEWRSVDMQLAVDRQSRDRVLLVRFLLHSHGSLGADAGAAGGNWAGREVGAEARRRRPATRAFLEALRGRLVEARMHKHALARLPGCEGLALDGQYLCQLEDFAREDMDRALEAQARALEDYARSAERRCSQLKSLLQPVFELYQMEQPVLGKPLPLSYYPLDLLSAYDDGSGRGAGEEKGMVDEEAGGDGAHAHACPGGCLACVEGLKARAWAGLLRRCDAEMTARLQRKNRQVVDRLGRVSDHERFLLRTLRDHRHRAAAVPAFRTLRALQQQQQQQQQGGGKDGDGEEAAPLYYCPCLIGARPATLYVTYGHLVFISRLPGFNWHRRVALRDVRAASVSPVSRLGFGMLAKTVEVEVPPPPAAASGGRQRNESIAFSSTTEPERLVELIKLLVSSIHAEDQEGGSSPVSER